MQPIALASVKEPPARTESRAWSRLPHPALVLTTLAAAASIAVYLWVALHRVGYPFELDWMEGGSVELVGRVLSGHSLYAAPSPSFVGWTYPPLYYVIAAAVAKVVGLGFLPLRLVSLIASLGAMATLGWMVIRETDNRTAGLVAAGLFAATFRISGAWFDTGRVDSLFLALTLLALLWGRQARGVRGGIGLGVLAFLAFFTKQTALLALAPALLYLVLTRRPVGIPAVLTLAALMLVSTVVLNASTGDWYGYYVFTELVHQSVAQPLWIGFWRDDILHQQWPLAILIVAGGGVLARRAWRAGNRSIFRSPAAYYAAAALGLIGSAWVSRLHTGGYANVLMPAYAAVALLAGLTYAHLSRAQLSARLSALAKPLLAVAVLLQLALLVYPIDAQIPTAADRTAGAQLISRLRALPGPVLVLRHPWYATVVGKGTFAQEEAIGDVLRSASGRGSRPLRASLSTALNADHVQAVVLDGTFDEHFFGAELARYFRLLPQPITPSRLYPLTDVRTSPTLLFLRKR
ncbi:MAG: glycosyltransferase family 39 protein [Actinomycetota bacterium]|nr:glycosyltransferase family 39 protein [Actinomycetota bacterium]